MDCIGSDAETQKKLTACGCFTSGGARKQQRRQEEHHTCRAPGHHHHLGKQSDSALRCWRCTQALYKRASGADPWQLTRQRDGDRHMHVYLANEQRQRRYIAFNWSWPPRTCHLDSFSFVALVKKTQCLDASIFVFASEPSVLDINMATCTRHRSI
jgi:hypothetical protein